MLSLFYAQQCCVNGCPFKEQCITTKSIFGKDIVLIVQIHVHAAQEIKTLAGLSRFLKVWSKMNSNQPHFFSYS